MKIGIVGLGSIGRRHAQHLQKEEIELFALRSGRGENTSSLEGIKDVFDLESFEAQELDGIIVSNPTAKHAELVESLKVFEGPLFVEKPLCNTMEELEHFRPYSENTIVGYCLRFHPLMEAAFSFLKSEMGRVYWGTFKRAYYLPLWHPGKDYRKEYMGSKALGGGVVRTLSHELDLMIHWFGSGSLLNSEIEQRSSLEIDVEDWAQFSCLSPQGAQIQFELDFINPDYTNEASLLGDAGRLHYDFLDGRLKLTKPNLETDVLFSAGDGHIDEMYRAQMQDFLTFIRTGESLNCSYDEAVQSMELIQQIAPY